MHHIQYFHSIKSNIAEYSTPISISRQILHDFVQTKHGVCPKQLKFSCTVSKEVLQLCSP